MADGIPIPPWLHGVSPGEIGSLYQSGVRTGVGVAEAQARIVQESQQMAQRFAMEQQKLEQERQQRALELELSNRRLQEESSRHAQQLEMTRQYHDQISDIRQSELKNQQQRVQLAGQQAAHKFAAQQRLQQRIAAAGGDENQIRQAILEEGPQIGGMSTEMGAALRAGEGGKQYGPITTEDLGGGVRAAYRPGSPGMHIISPARSREPTPAQLAALADKVPMLEINAKKDPNSLSAKLLKKIRPMIEQTTTTGDATVPPVAQREVGKVYQTPKGPHIWTGKGWRKPPTGSESTSAAPAQEPTPTESTDDESE